MGRHSHILIDLTEPPAKLRCRICGRSELLWLPGPWWRFWRRRSLNTGFSARHTACVDSHNRKIAALTPQEPQP